MVIVLGVKVVFACHGTRDAARIDIRIHCAVVDAVGNLAAGVGLGVGVGNIAVQIVGVGGVVPCPCQRVADFVHLLGDGAHIVDERLRVAAAAAVERGDGVCHRVQRAA